MDIKTPGFDYIFEIIILIPKYAEKIMLFQRDAYLKESFLQVGRQSPHTFRVENGLLHIPVVPTNQVPSTFLG